MEAGDPSGGANKKDDELFTQEELDDTRLWEDLAECDISSCNNNNPYDNKEPSDGHPLYIQGVERNDIEGIDYARIYGQRRCGVCGKRGPGIFNRYTPFSQASHLICHHCQDASMNGFFHEDFALSHDPSIPKLPKRNVYADMGGIIPADTIDYDLAKLEGQQRCHICGKSGRNPRWRNQFVYTSYGRKRTYQGIERPYTSNVITCRECKGIKQAFKHIRKKYKISYDR